LAFGRGFRPGRGAVGEFAAEDGEAGVGGDADFDLFIGNGGDGDFNGPGGKHFTNRRMGTDATGGDLNGLTGFSGESEHNNPSLDISKKDTIP